MRKCHTCGKDISENKKFCEKSCYFARRNYRSHSEETKQKIAAGNSKPHTEERKKNISNAKKQPVNEALLNKLKSFWKLGYLNPDVIKELAGLPPRSRIYNELFLAHCEVPQHKFMPSDWYPEHYSKLFELAHQNIWYKQIAKFLGFGEKQVVNVMIKLGLPINTRNPDAWSSCTSGIERQVLSWIQEEKFEIETQFHIGNFLYDCHIKNSNILVEVNGDYWHCNPNVYRDGPINDMQKSHIRRDFAKKDFAKRQGYYLITVWEKRIKENPEDTKQWVLGKIRSNMMEVSNDK